MKEELSKYNVMELKRKTREELEEKVRKLENLIAKKGVGSGYLSRAQRVQRDVNLALIVGGAAIILGAAAWSLYKYKGE